MKTTLDLPESLVKRVKLRAIQERRKLKDMVADLLRKGLATELDMDQDVGEPRVGKDLQTGLPVIECKQAASAGEELTPGRVADLLLDQEAEWHRDSGR